MTNPFIELLIDLDVNKKTSRANIEKYINELKDLKLDVTINPKGFESTFKSFGEMQGKIKSLETEIDQLNSKMSNTGKSINSNQIGADLDKIRNKAQKTSEAFNIKDDALKRQLQTLDKEALGTLTSFKELQNVLSNNQVKFKVGKNAKDEITSLVAQIQTEFGKLESFTFNPKMNKKGDIQGFNVTSALEDSTTFKLNESLEKSVIKLKELSKQGLLTGVEVNNAMRNLANATTNADIDRITKEFKDLAKETSIFESRTIALQKFSKELDKLHSKGLISSSEKQSFINEASLKSNTKEIQILQNNIQQLGQSTTSFNKLQNASEATKEKLNSLNEKLNNTLNSIGKNVDTSKLDIVRDKMNQLGNIKFTNETDIQKANSLFDSLNRRISALSSSGNSMERFNNTFAKATDILDKMEREGFASADSISKLRTQLNSVQTGNLQQVKDMLSAINKESNQVSSSNKLNKSIQTIGESTVQLNEKLNSTLNKLSGNVDTDKLTNIQNKMSQLSNMKILNEADAQKAISLIDSLNRRMTSLASSGNGMERFNDTLYKATNALDKLEREGIASTSAISKLKAQMTSVQSGNLQDAKNALRAINKEAEQSASLNKLNLAIKSIGESSTHLNEKLNLALNNLGKNVDTGKLDVIRDKISKLSTMQILNVADVQTANALIDSITRRISNLSTSANSMERFNNTIYKATEALDKMEREGYASSDSIASLRKTLASVETGNLHQARDALKQVNAEMKHISETNNMSKGVREVQNSILRLTSDLEKTVNLYRKSVNKTGVSELKRQINELSKLPLMNLSNITEAKHQISQVREGVKKLNADATTATRNSMSIIDAFKTAMSKFPV